jgi:catechol 2,3-dioxygenase-like lactoylglutathione lyase family enzyme
MENSALAVLELNHVALNVRDLVASIDFYEKRLGLKRIPRPDFSFGGAWFALGSQELHLIEDTDLAESDRRDIHFALRVESGRAAADALIQAGVTGFSGPAPRPDGAYQIFLADPDGHRIEILAYNP